SDNVEIYLQVGAASEDLDGDGVLDHEYSPYNRGYRFNDPANGANLLIGGGPRGNGNGRIDSEDIDSNSLLDPENGDRIYNPGSALLDMNVGGDTPPTSWSQENLPLAGSRSELTEARFVRIIVVRDGAAGDISGKVVVSPFRFRGAELSLSAEAGTEADEQNILDAVSVREVPETFSADPAPQKLSEAYPEVADIFHSGGAIQRVTEAKWSTVGSAAPGSFTLTGYTPSVPLRYYNSLTFYYRTPGLVSPGDKQLAIDYTDASGRGVHASFPPGVHEAWQRVVVDFSDRTVQVDGQEIAGASVEIDGRVENLNRFKATLSDDDGDSTGNFDAGALYIDEVSLTDPAGLVGTGAAAEVDYRIPGEIWTAGDVPILANLRLRESAYGATRGFSSEYGEPSATHRGTSSTSAGADILYTSLDIDLDISADEYDSSLAGGHRIQIPSFQSPVTLTDSYRTDQEGRSLSRSNSLTLRHSDIGQAELDTQSEIIDGTLSQNWNLSADSLWEASPALKLSLSIGKSQTGDYHEDGNYFSRWATGFRFLLPSREGSFLERTGSTDLSLSVPPEPVGLETRAELSYTSSRYTGRLQKNSGLFETTLPLSFSGPPSWGLDFGYSREFDFSRSFSGAGDYAEDFSVLGDDLASHSYIFLSIPYAELFLEKPADELAVASEGYETARYRPESFIRYTRNYGSRLIDLMIPSYAYLSAYREIEREASLIEERFGWSANIRNAAVNLFGRLGAYPFFDFYRTDEFGTGFGFTSDYLKSTGDQTYQLETDQFVYLEFTPGIYFRLEHALTTTLGEEIFEDSSSASFVWEIVPEKPWDLPLLSERIEKETVLSNTERFSLVFEQQGEDDRAPTIQLDLGHETALHFGEYGYIGARIELGWQRRPEPAVDGIDYYHLIGFLAAIEAHLTF
ncbi:MAG: hypothetical protein K9L68_10800, partial [Spirochaetales bacterium]|nr:hypothetical protein [Spirochaetales bacterium]MCF7939073.1 hypothetical protein [Spirochaetales bacterium]